MEAWSYFVQGVCSVLQAWLTLGVQHRSDWSVSHRMGCVQRTRSCMSCLAGSCRWDGFRSCGGLVINSYGPYPELRYFSALLLREQRVSVLTLSPDSFLDTTSPLFCTVHREDSWKNKDLAIPEILPEYLERFTCLSASVDEDGSCLPFLLCKSQILMERCQDLWSP